MPIYLGNTEMNSSYLGNQNIPTNDIFVPPLELVQSGLVFDFRAQDYQSGSLLWNAYVGNYTASITGTVGGGLNYIGGNKVGFDGNHWLQFSNNMTASISSSQWQVYALVEFTGQQTASAAFTPAFFSKGDSYAPSWNWYYIGAGASTGLTITNGYINSSTYTEGGQLADGYNQAFSGNSKQLFAFQINGSPTGSQAYGIITPNANTTIPGNSIAIAPYLYGLNSFTGSAASPLLFGKSFSADNINISGSIVRLFGYNRILNSTERQYNWNILQYPI